jgi:hypothetical protein
VYDKALLRLGYLIPHGAVIDRYGMMISKGKNEEFGEKLASVPRHLRESNLRSSGTDIGISGERPASGRVSCDMVSCDNTPLYLRFSNYS